MRVNADAYYHAPYNPTVGITAELRQANALEYIAAQLGMIREALEKQQAPNDQPK